MLLLPLLADSVFGGLGSLIRGGISSVTGRSVLASLALESWLLTLLGGNWGGFGGDVAGCRGDNELDVLSRASESSILNEGLTLDDDEFEVFDTLEAVRR